MLNINPITLEVAKLTTEVLPSIQRSDSALASGVQHSAQRRRPALGSAREVLACTEVALAIGTLRQQPLALIAKLNHVIGVLVKLVR